MNLVQKRGGFLILVSFIFSLIGAGSVSAICGDGVLDFGEQCDDGNNVDGDGCNAACSFEPKEQCIAPVDVMLVIDRSGSMVQPPDPLRLQNAKNAAITFVNQMNLSKDEVGLASFNQTATLNQELTNVEGDVTSAINALKAGGLTNIGGGIKVGRQELVDNGGPTKAMILLSDGAPNINATAGVCGSFTLTNSCAKYAINESNVTKLAGIEIFTIGLGITDNLTETLLKQIATTPSNYFSVPNSSNLAAIYIQIAQEICPCQGFDCSINSDQCNVGSCNVATDQCEFNQQPLSTSCEEDSTKCTTQHCNGQGACVVNATTPVPPAQECQSFYCDPSDGNVKANFTLFPLSTLCNTDQNLCTVQHCNGQGSCVVNETVDVPAPQQCKSFFCDPLSGDIKENLSGFPLSTPCEADGNLCTLDHCNGIGSCVLNNNVNCSGLNGQCQQGACDPQTGGCVPDFSSFPLSTPCNADSNLCTLDHCNGIGSCINFGNVFVPPAQQCQSFYCEQSTGQVNANFTLFPLSTPCSTDNNECTIEHCNSQGACVTNPQAELPPGCDPVIKDSKVSQSLPGFNFGLGRYMMVNPKQGGTDRSYLRIDASFLSSNVSLANLSLAVYFTGSLIIGSPIQAWYCRNHDFVETTINWNNQPLNGSCSLADTFIVPNKVIAGTPETWHSFDLTNETNFEINNGDGLFTIVLKSGLENTGILTNSRYVQYLTKEYPDADFRPKFEAS
ncbi:VWA domain-containing protein [Candidatus Woesearchaeota archaeon]|nr:VWA domain-containing protein [Candidatus Woesearchaeota archaeon]